MWRQQFSRAVVIGTAVVVFIICCVAPVFYLLFTSLGSAETAYAAVLLDVRQRGLLALRPSWGGHRRRRQRDWHTVGYCAGSRAIASKAGHSPGACGACARATVVALAWVYVGSNRGLVHVITGRDLLSEWTHSLPAAVGVLSLVLYPLSMLRPKWRCAASTAVSRRRH